MFRKTDDDLAVQITISNKGVSNILLNPSKNLLHASIDITGTGIAVLAGIHNNVGYTNPELRKPVLSPFVVTSADVANKNVPVPVLRATNLEVQPMQKVLKQ